MNPQCRQLPSRFLKYPPRTSHLNPRPRRPQHLCLHPQLSRLKNIKQSNPRIRPLWLCQRSLPELTRNLRTQTRVTKATVWSGTPCKLPTLLTHCSVYVIPGRQALPYLLVLAAGRYRLPNPSLHSLADPGRVAALRSLDLTRYVALQSFLILCSSSRLPRSGTCCDPGARQTPQHPRFSQRNFRRSRHFLILSGPRNTSQAGRGHTTLRSGGRTIAFLSWPPIFRYTACFAVHGPFRR